MAAGLYSLQQSKSKYRNWLKAGLAVLITKEGITPFVEDEIKQFQQKCLSDICIKNGLPAGTTCSGCCTENVVKCPTNRICIVGRGKCGYHKNAATQYIPSGCPGKICHNFKTEIQNAHRYHGPPYRNTDATQWCSNPWEVAKCFMPPDGYKDARSAAETSLNGINSVVINFEGFQSKVHDNLSKKNNIFDQAREVDKLLRHSPSLEVEAVDLQRHFVVLQTLLKDPGYLATNTDAQNALQKLSQLQNDDLVIGKDDVRKVLDDVADAVQDKIRTEKDEYLEEVATRNLQLIEITRNAIKSRERMLISKPDAALDSAVTEIETMTNESVNKLQTEAKKQVKFIAAEGDALAEKAKEEVEKLKTEADAREKRIAAESDNALKHVEEGLNKFTMEVDAGVKKVTSEAEKSATANSEAKYNKLKEGNLPKEILKLDRESVDLYKKALQNGKVPVHNIRVMVVGHYDVGKTTLTKRLLGEPVDIRERRSTHGIEVHIDRCKISLEDGTWILQNSSKTRKTLFHQLAELFRKENQQKETLLKHSEKIDTVSDSGDVPDVMTHGQSAETEIAQEQSTAAEHPVSETKQSAETVIYSESETASGSDIPSQSRVDDYEHSLKHLKKFIENVKTEDDHFGTSDLSLWDFAGQNVFYATHQVFFSRRAVYLLVTNMSKHINDTVDDDPWHNDCKGETDCKIAEYLDFWLNSIHEFCSDTEDSGPPVILVGTFADKLRKGISTDDACSSLRDFLIGKAASCHLTTENFVIENSVVDKNIDALRKHIIDVAKEQDYWGEDIPAKWVTLEDILVGIKEENIKVLPKERLRELNMTLPSPIETDEELELYLHFHHDMGNIIYFSEGDLANYVLLDPQWLIDAFKSVITAKSFCISRTNIQKKWMEFERTAVLKPELIDTVWKKHENSDYSKYRNLLLTYMEKLGLVARPILEENLSMKVVEWYFVPCMLKERPPETVTNCSDSDHCKSTSKLCYTTAEEPERRFFPTTVFNKLIAACLQRWPLSIQNRKSMIFCGGALFILRENHFLHIFFYDHVIQIWITRFSYDGQFPDLFICTETKDKVEYLIKSTIRMHSKIIAFVKCPRTVLYSNENMFPLEQREDFSGSEKVCFCKRKGHVVLFDELTRYWSSVEDLENSAEIEKDANRQFTEMDFCKITTRIGSEYVQLGFALGLSKAELDHIELDEKTTANKIMAILWKWNQTMGDEATYCRLKRALIYIGKSAKEATAMLDNN